MMSRTLQLHLDGSIRCIAPGAQAFVGIVYRGDGHVTEKCIHEITILLCLYGSRFIPLCHDASVTEEYRLLK